VDAHVILLASGIACDGRPHRALPGVNYFVPFILQFLLYASPIAYSIDNVPPSTFIYELNPLTWLLQESSVLRAPAVPHWWRSEHPSSCRLVFVVGRSSSSRWSGICRRHLSNSGRWTTSRHRSWPPGRALTTSVAVITYERPEFVAVASAPAEPDPSAEEIIVVDSSTGRDTERLVREQFPEVTYAVCAAGHGHGHGPQHQLHLSPDVLAFIDDDAFADRTGWRCSSGFDDRRRAVGGADPQAAGELTEAWRP